ncbi:MAG: hypothetical protein VXW13_06275, partial [SAR324 cluster bacterium]|nr:hypothetical protein [SAR324 cluster bacterium]
KILINGGGHKMAAGFSLNIKNFDKFKNFLSKVKFSNQDVKKQYVSKISEVAFLIDIPRSSAAF